MKKAFLFIIILIVGIVVVLVGMAFVRDGIDFDDAATIGRSEDAARSWSFDGAFVRADETTTPFRPSEPLFAAFHPQNVQLDTLFVGTRNEGLHRSLDAGVTWQRIRGTNDDLAGRVTVYDIAIDPRNSQRWYLAALVGGIGQVIVTEDGGKTFTSTYHASREGHAVFDVEIDPFRPDVVYVATAEGLLLESNDRGEEWRTMQLFDNPISHLVMHPNRSDVMFMLVQGQGLMRSRDRGASFATIGSGLPRRLEGSAISFAVDPRRPHVMMLAAPQGLFRTDTSGDDWSRVPIIIPPSALPIRDVAFSYHDTGTTYVAAGGTVYVSRDDGEEWQVRPLPDGAQIRLLVSDPRVPDRLFVGITP